jgi:hypothetical protein
LLHDLNLNGGDNNRLVAHLFGEKNKIIVDNNFLLYKMYGVNNIEKIIFFLLNYFDGHLNDNFII